MTSIAESAPTGGNGPGLSAIKTMAVLKWLALGVIAIAMTYTTWALYLSGEPLFAMVVMAIAIGIVTVFGFRRFYGVRFFFPAVTTVLVFIALPVLYTSYVGFTNFGSRNLLTFDRVTSQFLAAVDIDKATERPFSLVKAETGYRLFFPKADGGGYLTETTPLDGTPVELTTEEVATAPATVLEMRDAIKFRNSLAVVSAILPDGTDLSSAGLRTFATVRPVYERQSDGVLLNRIDGSTLTPDQSVGFYRNDAGQAVAPGWRVGVGLANFQRVLFSDGVREPMLEIFVWTVVFAFLSVLLTFSLGLLLASILQWPHLKGRAVYRILLILPYAVPAFISILVFRGLFNQNFGEINLILRTLFGTQPLWFTDPFLARTMTVMVNVWLGYPYMMLLAMGYLQSVPEDQKKAAALEGAGPLRVFFSITLPQIMPPFVPLLIASFAFNFNNVVLILLLTRGLPDIAGTTIPAGHTDILGSFTYRISFMDSGQDFGLAGAISALIFILVGIIAYTNFIFMRRAAAGRGATQ
jgi:maltose/maltodextrin transport system permease protein